MERRLNLKAVQQAMANAGLNAASLAKELEVSREAASKWLNGESLPRPDKLLKLAIRLQLKLDQLVVNTASSPEPVIAFRKRGASKTTDAHIAHAKEMGVLLRHLVKHLPADRFDPFVRPATLKQPSAEYRYLQDLVGKVRKEIGLQPSERIDFHHLIKRFSDTQTVLIPVLWGKKEKHQNALHIFLPDSMTTWVYLNLDVEVHDFKFWMAHELGHIWAPDLEGEAGEDFADAFAGALLFPEVLAKEAYARISAARNAGTQINLVKDIAEESLISPITVYIETNKYAEHDGLKKLKLEPGIYGAAKNLSRSYYSVSEAIFESDRPDPNRYIAYGKGELASSFFDALAGYLRESGAGAGYIQSILDVPLIDAREIHAVLK